ncbi:MAG: hypothetical protein AB4426_30765 [Xenococcaceae cyanobacterium]
MRFSTLGLIAAGSLMGIQSQLVNGQSLFVSGNLYQIRVNYPFFEGSREQETVRPASTLSAGRNREQGTGNGKGGAGEEKDNKLIKGVLDPDSVLHTSNLWDNPKSVFPGESQGTGQNPKSIDCPADVETLTSLLLQDIPSYANRVIQRARRLNRSVDIFGYVIVAGKPEFEPLNLSQSQYTSVFQESPEQIFFTTLERQYFNDKVIETENYHWLFLTQTKSGWRMAMVFSRLGSTSKGRPPSPPRESSNGVIGQAIRLWLRDCRAGTIRTPVHSPLLKP